MLQEHQNDRSRNTMVGHAGNVQLTSSMNNALCQLLARLEQDVPRSFADARSQRRCMCSDGACEPAKWIDCSCTIGSAQLPSSRVATCGLNLKSDVFLEHEGQKLRGDILPVSCRACFLDASEDIAFLIGKAKELFWPLLQQRVLKPSPSLRANKSLLSKFVVALRVLRQLRKQGLPCSFGIDNIGRLSGPDQENRRDSSRQSGTGQILDYEWTVLLLASRHPLRNVQ